MTEPAAQGAPEGQQGPSQAPPWGSDEDFNPEKAWNLIQNLRGDLDKVKNRPVLTDEMKSQLDEYQRINDAAKSDLERAREEATRWQSDADSWRKAAVGSKIQALAAADFADPSDALTALADENFLDAGGQIDENAIRAKLNAVLQTKPHWRKPVDTSPRAPQPNAAQGTSGTPAKGDPAQEFAAVLQTAMQAR